MVGSFNDGLRALLLAATATALLSGCDDNGSDGPAAPLAAPALAFTAPGQSLDLANYTLVAQYDLPVGSGDNLLGAESSAVTYNKDTDTLFITSDHGTSVYQVKKNGEFVDTMTLPAGDGPQGTLFYDPEGIAYVGNGEFVIAEERYRQVDRFTYVPGTTLMPGAYKSVKLGTTIGNIGLEGISFDPMTGGFIVVKEKTPLGIFQTTIDFNAGTASNGSATAENSTNLFDPALAGVADFGDVYALSNTLANTAADHADLLVLSQESGLLLKMDRAGKILSRLDVGLTAQHEGVTLDKDRILYLANELGGGAGKPQLWVYQPTTSADAVGVGSNLYLGFAVPVAAGSGNITISNGTDTRTIAIGDAEQVSISGNTVSINPAAVLLPGTTYTVTAPAGLVRAATGGSESDAVSTTFKTRAEAVPPTLTATAPADNAINVTGSRVLLTFSEPVVAGSGNIVLTGSGGDLRTIAVGDITQVTISGNTVDINPSADLRPGTAYHLQIARDVIRDVAGNAFAGLIGAEALNFTTATADGGPPPTVLDAGDLLFIGINGDAPDAIAFVLLKDVATGTQIGFTDKDYSAASPTFPTNEAAFVWTADKAYPAGSIVTIQTDTAPPTADLGMATGSSGGISTSAETYYAFQGSIIDAAAGQITVERFLATINLGDAAGDIPPAVTAAGASFHFAEDNARYAGSLDRSDLAAFAARLRDPANWERNDSAGYALIDGSLFGVATPPPVGGTELNPGDVLFVGMNADVTDAFAFVLLKDVLANTVIAFTDKNYTAGAASFPTNEAAFTWTADKAYAAGTLVTIQPDGDVIAADRGAAAGDGGGIGTSGETYYAFQGTITDAGTGAITVDRFLAAINLGPAAGDIPAELTAAGAVIHFDEDNARYTGSLDRADLAAFAARVKDSAHWSRDDANAYPIADGSLFGGTVLAAGDLLFMAANADKPDAIAFVLLKDVIAGTRIGFTDKDYAAAAAFPTNEAAFTWTADVAYAAGSIVTIDVDALTVDKGMVYGKGGGISPNAETYYAFQGTVLNPEAGQVYVDRFLAAINLRAAAGEIPAELTAAGAYIRFDADNARYAGSLERSDLAAFAARVKDAAQWATNNDAAYPITGGSLFP